MEYIWILVKIWFVSWMITRFEPLHMLLELLPDKLFYNMLSLILTCLKCLSMWMTLIVTGDIFLSSLLCFISFFYEKNLGHWERRVRLN